MSLQETIETLTVLGDESRIRLCTLLADRELCVTDLVRVTGISQSRVSTHLGRLREAGIGFPTPQRVITVMPVAGQGSLIPIAHPAASPTSCDG